MKKICVSIVGSGQLHEVTIQPGTTAGDILRDLNLSDYLLSRNPSADFFASSESIYEKVSDGQKIFASTKATVGGEFLSGLLSAIFEGIASSPASVSVQASQPMKHISHAHPVQRRLLPYWQESGWSKVGNVYRGNYQTRYGAYQGWIEERSPFEIHFFIFSPPNQVLHSSHGACFQPRGDWFNVHMSQKPKDVSSGIIAVERLISECLELGKF
jgi:hypothetical protein